MKIKPNKPFAKHNPVSHGGLYSAKKPTSDIIDFSSNINPLGPHPGVKQYIKKQTTSKTINKV